ncbi:MAG TPA: hypothetical protein VIN09_12675 [Chloroflexota bacterium]
MQAVPLAVYLALLELAVGSFLILLLTDLDGEVGRGFLVFAGLFGAGAAALALWMESAFPTLVVGAAQYQDVFARAFQAHLALWGLYLALLVVGRRRLRHAAAGLGTLAGAVALALTGLAHGLQVGWSALGVATLAIGALAMGSVVNGLLLGHWYLVTPRLSPRPLTRMTVLLLAALALQLATTLGYLALVALGVLAPTVATALLQENGVVFWLRLAAGLGFSVVLGVLTLKACKRGAMQAATGLLYVAVGTVGGGELVGKTLALLTGTPL